MQLLPLTILARQAQGLRGNLCGPPLSNTLPSFSMGPESCTLIPIDAKLPC